MADGYGAGLFDDSGPKNFATAVGKISSELTGVSSAFTSFGSTASGSLTTVANAIDALLGKLGQLAGQLTGLGTQLGTGGGGAQGGGAPAPTQGGPPTGSQWSNPPSPNAQTGTADALSGMPQGTAGQGGWASRMWGKMGGGSAGTVNAPYGGTQPTGTAPTGAGGMTLGSATMGQRAIQSMVPAAIGAATSYAGGLTATAIQGATIGQMYAPAFGVNPRSLYVIPGGTLAQSPQDYAQSNYIALQSGMAPGTANWSTAQTASNQLMTLLPGMSRQQSMQTFGQQMMSPQTLNSAMAFGFNFSPGGRMMNPQQQYQEVWTRLTAMTGGRPTAQQVQDWLRPGGPWQSNLAALGWAPGSAEAQGFQNFALTQVGLQGQGKTMPSNVGTQAGAVQAGLNTPYWDQLQKQTAQSRLESQAEPDLARAASLLNDAATKLLNLVQGPAGFLGGGGGGLTGAAGGLLGWGVAGAGTFFGAKAAGGLISKLGGGLLGKLGGGLGGGAGAAEEGANTAGLFGRLGGLFGGGAAAGEEGSLALGAGLEGAGAAADASVVGLPLGLVLGAAGLGVTAWGFRHQIGHGLSALGHGIGNIAGGMARGAGSLASGVGSGLGSIAKGVGGFIGGLFGGGGSSAPSDPHGSLSDLLASKPPTNSLVACLTQPIRRNAGTLASALVYSSGGTGPSAQGGAAGGGGGGNPPAGAGGVLGTSGSGWNYKTATIGAADTSGLFKNPYGSGSTATLTSSTSSNTAGGGGGNAGTPSGGSAAQNAALAQQMAAGSPWGWTGAQWTALNNVAMRESGWSMTAKNPSSGAYGIAQFINGPSEYQQYGGNSNTAQGQITGFLNYIKQRYGTPTAAWQHEQQYGWYERGTQLVARTQLAMLHKGEAVVPAADNYSSPSYNKNGSAGSGGGSITLNFKAGSVILQVPPSATSQDMENIAEQFVAAVTKPQVIAGVRSS